MSKAIRSVSSEWKQCGLSSQQQSVCLNCKSRTCVYHVMEIVWNKVELQTYCFLTISSHEFPWSCSAVSVSCVLLWMMLKKHLHFCSKVKPFCFWSSPESNKSTHCTFLNMNLWLINFRSILSAPLFKKFRVSKMLFCCCLKKLILLIRTH